MLARSHPIPYQGSKRNLAREILKFFPERVERIVEPFAGTGAISVAAAARSLSEKFWFNDINRPLIELLELIIEAPNEIAEAYTKLWHQQEPNSIAHYVEVRDIFNQTQEPKLFLYLLARCVKGAVRYNSKGYFNQGPDKRRKGTHPERMRRNIEAVSALLKSKCKFTDWDYREVLERVKSQDFVYLDPPYQGVCGKRDSRYAAGIDFNEFIRAIENLNHQKIAFIISYDGRRGSKTFGNFLPPELRLTRVEIEAGRSSQATLLGREEITVESLYLSENIPLVPFLESGMFKCKEPKQLELFEGYGQLSVATR